jgi:protein SCO1/2
MTTRRVLALLLVVMAVAVAVARTRTSQPPPATVTTYPVTGVVTAAPADGRLMVSHEAIPGYMPAMTMPFALAPGDPVPAMGPGDRVRFTLEVASDSVLATGFEVLGRDEAVASALRGPAAPSRARVRKGDAIPDLALVTQAGAPFTAANLRGKVTALTFIFTRCPVPEFCPLMVKRFQEVQRLVADDSDLADVRLLAVTLDPAFDTPPVLDAYARAMRADPARWQFATGPEAEIARLTRAFAIHVERNGVLLDHTLATAVIGPDGRVVEIWRGNGWTPEQVVTTLRAAPRTTD